MRSKLNFVHWNGEIYRDEDIDSFFTELSGLKQNTSIAGNVFICTFRARNLCFRSVEAALIHVKAEYIRFIFFTTYKKFYWRNRHFLS